MFDIGFGELLLVAILGLLVLGPERLPEAVRTIGLWVGRFKRTYRQVRQEIEKEIGADEIRRQLQNEEVMHSLQSSRQEIQNFANEASASVQSEEIKASLNASKEDLENIVNQAKASAKTSSELKASAKTSSEIYAESLENTKKTSIDKND